MPVDAAMVESDSKENAHNLLDMPNNSVVHGVCLICTVPVGVVFDALTEARLMEVVTIELLDILVAVLVEWIEDAALLAIVVVTGFVTAEL